MNISVMVSLAEGDSFAYSPEQAAQQVIAALGGDLTKDSAMVSVTMPAGHYTPDAAADPEEEATPNA